MDAINSIWQGRAGLAKTYWLYGIAAGFAWAVAISAVTPGSPAAVIAMALFCAYFMVVNTGIWRAAGAYEGPGVFASLAKGAAILGHAAIAFIALSIVLAGGRGQVAPTPAPSAMSAPTSPAAVNWSDFTPVDTPATR